MAFNLGTEVTKIKESKTALKFQAREPGKIVALFREMEKSSKTTLMSSVLYIIKIHEIKEI